MPRIVADSVPEHRARLHGQVYDAFAQLMRERSYDAITMAGLAERAGLGRTAIYHHFPDKEAVLVGFAIRETDAYVARLQDTLAGVEDPADGLRVYVRHQLDVGEEFHIGLGPALSAGLSETARVEIRSHVHTVEEVLRDILDRGHAAGRFRFDELGATIALVHACLGQRHLPPAAVERFVLQALSAGES